MILIYSSRKSKIKKMFTSNEDKNCYILSLKKKFFDIKHHKKRKKTSK